MIGALLHDIGKGYPGDHTEAGMDDRAPTRVPGSGSGRATSTCWWRWSNTTCSFPTSRLRRDLTDTATIEKVAEAVETVERLDLLPCAHGGRFEGDRSGGVGLVEGGTRRRTRRPGCVTCSVAAMSPR